MNIVEKVKTYLLATSDKFEIGQYEYYSRIALEQSVKAFEEKNYGIGAVAVLATDEYIMEFRARNAMVTGVGVVDHAETRALLRLKGGKQPDFKYPKNSSEWTLKLPNGISVFGTLEPCPMCACTLTNCGAMLSVSTVPDGKLITTDDGYKISDGAANVTTNKFKIQPRVWQDIQVAHKIKFEILNTTDVELVELSRNIFLETREEIDRELASRGLYNYHAIRTKGLI